MRLGRAIRVGMCLATLAVAAVGFGCTAKQAVRESPEAVQIPSASTISSPKGGAYTGVFTPPAPFDVTALDAYARKADKQPSIVMWFQPWARDGVSRFDSALVVTVLQRGAVPLITWEPWDPGKDANLVKDPANQPGYRLQRIVDGEFDAYIRSWARAIKQVGGPVMLRPMHEMNGSWYPWCGTVNGNDPKQFAEAWRHIVDIFLEEGVTNVTWVWSINRESSPGTLENAYDAYYPGDTYVDWTSISGFNWGTSRPGTRWQSFAELYDRPLSYLRQFGKPIVLSEFACAPDGGDKAAWIEDAYRTIQTQHPEVDAVVYYDKLEQGLKLTQDWRITSSPDSESAYREAISSDYFIGRPTTELQRWGDRLTDAQWAHLRSIQPVY